MTDEELAKLEEAAGSGGCTADQLVLQVVHELKQARAELTTIKANLAWSGMPPNGRCCQGVVSHHDNCVWRDC